MEKQTTAMQTLISEIKQLQSKPYINPKNALNDCLLLAMGNLKLERQQIEDAHQDWARSFSLHINGTLPNGQEQIFKETAKQYFKQTFK